MATAFNFEEYFQAKFEEKLFNDDEEPENHMTAATRLLEKKREMSELEQALSTQKEEFESKMRELSTRREELDKKELNLRSSLIKFDQFLIENDVKKRRAMKKADMEGKLKEQSMEEIRKKLLEKEKLESFLTKQRKRLAREKVYRSYLEAVVEGSTEFNELRDILRKHETLSINLEELFTKSNAMSDELDAMKHGYMTMISKNNEETMRFTNDIADLTWKKENASSTAQKWESLWTHIQNTAARNVLLLGRIKMATENVYIQIYRQRGITPKEILGIDEQLKKIKTYIIDLTDIIQESEKQEEINKANMGVFERLNK